MGQPDHLGRPPARETPTAAFWVFLSFTASAVTFVFRHVPDVWTGMTGAMGLALAGAVLLASVRNRLRPSARNVVLGLLSGALLYAATYAGAAALGRLWPGFEGDARLLVALRGTHGLAFLVPTLVLIVVAEEAVWRGVVARYLMERKGRVRGVVAGAVLYALAHLATLNPLLLAAALGCGLVWGLLYAVTDSLVPPLVCHLVWDAFLLFLLPVVR
jgi:membrane protease YdiL (CAAX protease family)